MYLYKKKNTELIVRMTDLEPRIKNENKNPVEEIIQMIEPLNLTTVNSVFLPFSCCNYYI